MATRTAARVSHVTVHVPADATFDLAKFGKIVASLGEKLGCQGCISGASCNFVIASEFAVDPATFAVKEVAFKM